MIVALARKLAIALRRYVETGPIPDKVRSSNKAVDRLMSSNRPHSPMVAPVGVALVGGLDRVTARPLGEGAEVAFSPIPGSVMVHARKLVASRIGAAGYESMRSLTTRHGPHRKAPPWEQRRNQRKRKRETNMRR